MTSMKGTCRLCGKIRWIKGAGNPVCKPCSYPVGVCRKCSYEGKIYVDGLCYCCYQDRLVGVRIDRMLQDFRPASDYNTLLFDLYLTYIRRYRLQYYHIYQTRGLIGVLETEDIPVIDRWTRIYDLADRHPLVNRAKGKGNGCVFLKIGYMLQELAVLPPREDEQDHRIAAALDCFPTALRSHVESYMTRLTACGRTGKTLVNQLRHLRRFFGWLSRLYPDCSFEAASRAKVEEFLDFIRSSGYAPSMVRDNYMALRRFYDWLVYKRRVFANPCTIPPPPPRPRRVVVCSDDQIEKLFAYVRRRESDPEGAFLLALILFFGLTTDDLIHARIGTGNTTLQLILHRRPRSCGRHYYNRDQVLKLPGRPEWFVSLQKRFYTRWTEAYAKVKATYPNYPLILPRHGHYNRTIDKEVLLKRIYCATRTATGSLILPKVLRQTCGHLHSSDGDASLLARLGWGPEYAFDYTWMPREIHPPRKKLPKHFTRRDPRRGKSTAT